jgi:hypothetical protein
LIGLPAPASQDRIAIVFDCRMAKDPGMMSPRLKAKVTLHELIRNSVNIAKLHSYLVRCIRNCVMNGDRKRSQFVPTDEQRIAVLYDSVFYEILFAFGISRYDANDYCAWEHINFSRMGHARALYDFFETPTAKRREDDVICEDFGFPARPIDRPADDRTRLNKQLFHITYTRLHYNETSKPWPDTIISCLHDRCVEFIRHLLCQRAPLIGPEEAVIWQALLDRLTSGHELLIARPFLPNGVAPGYRFEMGMKLQSGRSELTRPFVATR